MNRPLFVLFWILVGALAASAGFVYFLYQANRDRAGLVLETERYRADVEQKASALIDQAQTALTKTSAEMTEAKKHIQNMEQERILVMQAVKLESPPTRNLKKWLPTLSWPLGLNLDLPPNTTSTLEHEILTATLARPLEGGTDWLTISTYNQEQETGLLSLLRPPTSTALYVVADRLLIGQKGVVVGSQDAALVLRISKNASSTHLLWMRERPGITERILEQVLSTLNFRS